MNYRHKQQLNELTKLKPFIETINIESKFKLVKDYEIINLIDKNFIQYSEGIKKLIHRIYKNICANYRINKLTTTFYVKARNFASVNKQLGIMTATSTIQSRLELLEKDGVIKRIKNIGNGGGQFIYFIVDITQTFDRRTKQSFLNKEEVEETQELDKETVELQQDEEDTDTDLIDENTDLIDENEKLKQEIKRLKQKITQLQQNMETKKTKKSTELILPDDIDEQFKQLNIQKEQFEDFKTIFHEFCDKRKDSKGRTICAKENNGIQRTINDLKRAQEQGYNPYEVLKLCLDERWRGIHIDKERLTRDINCQYKEIVVKKMMNIKANQEIEKEMFKNKTEKRIRFLNEINKFESNVNSIEYNENVFTDGVVKSDYKKLVIFYIIQYFTEQIDYPSKKELFKEIAFSTIKALNRQQKYLTIKMFYDEIHKNFYKEDSYKFDKNVFLTRINTDMFSRFFK